jgi:hypothetical protein
VIPDPDRNDTLPADGRDVPATDFWLRRLRDGDVIPADALNSQKTDPGDGIKKTAVISNPDGTATLVGDHPAPVAVETPV